MSEILNLYLAVKLQLLCLTNEKSFNIRNLEMYGGFLGV